MGSVPIGHSLRRYRRSLLGFLMSDSEVSGRPSRIGTGGGGGGGGDGGGGAPPPALPMPPWADGSITKAIVLGLPGLNIC